MQKNVPKVNAMYHDKLENSTSINERNKVKKIIEDTRFGPLFDDDEYQIDMDSDAWKMRHSIAAGRLKHKKGITNFNEIEDNVEEDIDDNQEESIDDNNNKDINEFNNKEIDEETKNMMEELENIREMKKEEDSEDEKNNNNKKRKIKFFESNDNEESNPFLPEAKRKRLNDKKAKLVPFESRVQDIKDTPNNNDRQFGAMSYTFTPTEEKKKIETIRKEKQVRRENYKNRRSMKALPGFNPKKKKTFK